MSFMDKRSRREQVNSIPQGLECIRAAVLSSSVTDDEVCSYIALQQLVIGDKEEELSENAHKASSLARRVVQAEGKEAIALDELALFKKKNSELESLLNIAQSSGDVQLAEKKISELENKVVELGSDLLIASANLEYWSLPAEGVMRFDTYKKDRTKKTV